MNRGVLQLAEVLLAETLGMLQIEVGGYDQELQSSREVLFIRFLTQNTEDEML